MRRWVGIDDPDLLDIPHLCRMKRGVSVTRSVARSSGDRSTKSTLYSLRRNLRMNLRDSSLEQCRRSHAHNAATFRPATVSCWTGEADAEALDTFWADMREQGAFVTATWRPLRRTGAVTTLWRFLYGSDRSSLSKRYPDSTPLSVRCGDVYVCGWVLWRRCAWRAAGRGGLSHCRGPCAVRVLQQTED